MIRANLCICIMCFCICIISGCATSQSASAPALSADASPLERKLAENPNDREVNFALGGDAESHGDLLRAEQYYRRAEALGMPAEQIVPRIIRVLIAAHRYDEALDRCHRRLEQKPDDRATRFVEAALLVALERPKEAERDLHALIESQPKDPEGYLALGRLYQDERKSDRAKEMFHKYLELAPNGEHAAQVRFELAGDGDASELGGSEP